MIREHSSEPFPLRLLMRLEDFGRDRFSRSAVLVREPRAESWKLIGCVVRPVEMGTPPLSTVMYEYPNAVLLHDVLEASQCISFIESLSSPGFSIEGRRVVFDCQAQTEVVRVGVSNYWMEPAGTVYIFSPKDSGPVAHQRLLLEGAPYFPDQYEAAKYWLGLRAHHGSSDGNNGKVMVLLPETRGFIEAFKWVAADSLELQIAGPTTPWGKLQIIGAYWSPAGMTQLASQVTAGRTVLKIAPDARRLELFVMAGSEEFYEHHHEQLGVGLDQRHFLGARSQLGDASAFVKAAVAVGEGLEVEFKAWVDIEGVLKENTKLMQVMQTVAAFANTSGGTVYIGIDNHSEVIGINADLAKSTKRAPDEEAARRYLGALRTRVNDSLSVPTFIEPALADVGGKFVAMLRIARSQVPVSIGTECVLYTRKGATNAKVPPAEWLLGVERRF